MDEPERTWAEVFTEAYREQGFGSDEEAAYKLGVSLRTIRNYKTGASEPRFRDLKKIAPKLGLAVSVVPASAIRSRVTRRHIRGYLVACLDLLRRDPWPPFEWAVRGTDPERVSRWGRKVPSVVPMSAT